MNIGRVVTGGAVFRRMFNASVQTLRRLPLCVGLSTARSRSRGPETLLETHPGAAIQPSCQAALASPDRPAGSFEDRTTTQQETLASRPMIAMPGLLRDGGCATVQYGAPPRHRAKPALPPYGQPSRV